ncbi:hypothetical protein GQ457_07G000630 [Hibiscus cannabinus]
MDQRWRPKAAAVPYSKEQLKALFRRFDGDKDGHLSKSELKKAFNELGSRVAAFRALGALQHADENGDKLGYGNGHCNQGRSQELRVRGAKYKL